MRGTKNIYDIYIATFSCTFSFNHVVVYILRFLGCVSPSHHVVEDEAGVRQFEVFDETVELPAVEGAPGTVEVVSGLRLLPRVAVVLELDRHTEDGERDTDETDTNINNLWGFNLETTGRTMNDLVFLCVFVVSTQ